MNWGCWGIRCVPPSRHLQLELGGVAGIPIKNEARIQKVLGADCLTRRIALLPAAAIFVAYRQAGGQGVRERAAEEPLGVHFVEPAIGQIGPGLKSPGRLGGNVVDRAARRILAE